MSPETFNFGVACFLAGLFIGFCGALLIWLDR